jgi:general secretion pathway protein M
MRRKVPARQHVIVSYLVLTTLVAVLTLVALRAPVLDRLAFFDRLNVLRDLYSRSSLVIDSASDRFDDIRLISELPDVTFLPGETPALAAAELQNRIKRIVEEEDAVLVSSAFEQSSEPQVLTPITVSVRARSSVEALQQILIEFESDAPMLFLDNLTIQSRHRPGRLLRETNEELDLEFRVTGYVNRPRAL